MRYPKISVIVPVYNVERYLHRCIDSILSQTFTDFELLLIDDGSKDESGKICDEYAQKDARVRVFHKKNGGVSSARNMGLENAKGEWVAFVDADDWVDVGYLESFVENTNVDFVISSFVEEGDKKAKMQESTLSLDIDMSSLTNEMLDIIGMPIFLVPWCKVFKTAILKKEQLFFDETLNIGEDTLFVRQYLLYINTVRILPFQNYHYYRDKENCLSMRNDNVEELFHSMECLVNQSIELARKFHCTRAIIVGNSISLFWGRFCSYLQSYRGTFWAHKNVIERIVEHEYNRLILLDRIPYNKGKRSKLFDFLAKYKLYTILTIYIRNTNRSIY